MSFSNKPTRPDSKDTAKLRAEYESKARQFRESSDPATKAKLRDEKQKLFGRVVEQMTQERKEHLHDQQKVLERMGRFKSSEQVAKERAEANSANVSRGNQGVRA